MEPKIHDGGVHRGFSLIELIVAIAILLLLMGGLLASYNSYNQNQTVRQAAFTVRANLRLAQSKALSALKPESGCSELRGYQVSFTATSYMIQAYCYAEGPTGGATTINLPGDLSFSPVPSTMTFGVVTRGLLNQDSPVNVTITGLAKTYLMVVSPNGDITDSGFQ